MPTYEYICAKCKHTFETVQPITAKALTVCPRDLCPKKTWGKGKVKRAIGTGGLIFKGSGFYITDYRSDKYKAAAKKDSGTGSGSSSEGAKKEGKSPAAGGSPGTGAASSAPAASSPPSTPKKD